MPRQDKAQDALSVETGEPRAGPSGGSFHGIWIALATFVPTFLAVVFGIPYLAGLPTASRFPAALHGSLAPVVPSLAPEQGLVEAPSQEPAPMMPSGRLTGRAGGKGDELARLPSTPTRETQDLTAVAAVTPAISPPLSQRARPQVEAKAAEPKRSAPTVTKDHVWVRGAAFSDRDSAERLAARIEHQGYAAKVRREETPTTPWVVWIDHHSKRMTSAERHK
jgi:SPOR domain